MTTTPPPAWLNEYKIEAKKTREEEDDDNKKKETIKLKEHFI